MNGESVRFFISTVRSGGGATVRFVGNGEPWIYAGPDPNDPNNPNSMEYRGFWLFREGVPEPATIALLMMAFAAAPLVFGRRRPVHVNNNA
jgi:hypothetical protein